MNGDKDAMLWAGIVALNARFIPKNAALGIAWLTKIADAGDVRAMMALADHYYSNGDAARKVVALQWYQKAAAKGNELASARIEMMRNSAAPSASSSAAEARAADVKICPKCHGLGYEDVVNTAEGGEFEKVTIGRSSGRYSCDGAVARVDESVGEVTAGYPPACGCFKVSRRTLRSK